MNDSPAKTFYDRISHAYDFIADGGEHVARERGLALLNVRPGESVLEVGYGTGHSLVTLANSVGVDGHVRVSTYRLVCSMLPQSVSPKRTWISLLI